MSYALARPSNTKRSRLLGLVIGFHALIIVGLLSAKAVTPQTVEIPMVVDLLDLMPAPQVTPPAARHTPSPVSKAALASKPQSAPKIPTPPSPLEATQSTQAAPLAPQASISESKPAPAAPAAAPATSESPARFDADYLRNPAPPYPAISRRSGEEGKVVLRVQVSPQGTAESIDIKTSSGIQRLDEAALNTVRKWKFIPAKRGETAIQSTVLVPIVFKLEQ